MLSSLNLPDRQGPAPKTLGQLPHSQLTQHGPDDIVDALHAWCFALPNISNENSRISVPGSRALILEDGVAGNHAAFMIGREFAHIHPKPDNGSMHLVLPTEDVAEIKRTGWGEDHYLVSQGQWPVGLVMIFSPRDENELSTVKQIVGRSYEFATGTQAPV
ncbi:hypothetical protein J7399_19530 [Shimia sp. R9_1]|uniref:luciferase domain-containing protein n=1 Tax=Shimia sp. R9_1 TaxID=2821111 RepID=UPI001ADA420F|nr:luciferase family protein [Shimia sp. R9_1]MBO9409638.1 hypothetical protein [Shimia sp. R9_1]